VVTLVTSKIFSRSKKVFKSARAAWAAIGAATGLEPKDVRTAGHTKTAWRWIKKGVKRTKNVAKKRKTKSKRKTKRKRSAKQRANDKKLGRMAKRRSKPGKTRKKNKSTKPRKKSMAKGGIRSKLQGPLVKKVLMAAGVASIATAVASIVLPNQAQLINSPIVKGALGFVVGDFPGAITNFLLSGGIGSVTGALNGGTAAGTGGNTGGFA